MSQESFLPYGKHQVTEEDIAAVTEVLRSDWLTQGPEVPEFEHALADNLGCKEVVVCSSGTAALHLAMCALGLERGDAIVTSPLTFVATANCARYLGADICLADIDRHTGLIDPERVDNLLANDHEKRIKAIVPVHFAGQAADLPRLYEIAQKYSVCLIDDACHAMGGSYVDGKTTYRIGGNPHSNMTAFSFHPVKHLAAGEGGAIATSDGVFADRLRQFRNHGIRRDKFENSEMASDPDGRRNGWYYEMQQLGYNYRMTDLQAALGASQLKRLSDNVGKRQKLAGMYDRLIADTFDPTTVSPMQVRDGCNHAYHLYVVRIAFDRLQESRTQVMAQLRENGIGSQVHYIPLHLQPYYRRALHTGPGDFPQAEAYYEEALTLPLYPQLTEKDVVRVVQALAEVVMVETSRQKATRMDPA
jgi:UDP-4-amino-4,6-dideoxy-N-acetyl-beta-L-altrosamine transaminase